MLSLLRSGPATTPELTDRLLERRIVGSAYRRLHSLRTQGYVRRVESEPGRPWTLTASGRARAGALAPRPNNGSGEDRQALNDRPLRGRR